MKILFYFGSSLIVAVVLAAAIGYGPTRTHWGAEGIRSLMATGAICLAAALAGAVPTAFVAPRWPSYTGQAVLAGTMIRLFFTAVIGLAYYLMMHPHLVSFALWASIFYLWLLAIETCGAVLTIRKYYPATPAAKGVSA